MDQEPDDDYKAEIAVKKLHFSFFRATIIFASAEGRAFVRNVMLDKATG